MKVILPIITIAVLTALGFVLLPKNNQVSLVEIAQPQAPEIPAKNLEVEISDPTEVMENGKGVNTAEPTEEPAETSEEIMKKKDDPTTEPAAVETEPERKQAFARDDLKTNTAKISIPFAEILGGGPGKDGIPALDNPTFISVNAAKEIENDDTNGLLVESGGEAKFYPYNILVWHEIVNDTVGGAPVLVTFCPLCGTGIVFDPRINGKQENFGVSGKLWESNLLMFDRTTESLWSQALGRAVVGDKLGEELPIFPSQLLSFKEFSEQYPNGKVLSRDTGHTRVYDFYPYGNYDDNDSLYFPVSVTDNRLSLKEIMYVVPTGNQSVAFARAALIESGSATVSTASGTLTAIVEDGKIIVKNPSGKVLPGYHEMFFSWATHHQDDGVVWSE